MKTEKIKFNNLKTLVRRLNIPGLARSNSKLKRHRDLAALISVLAFSFCLYTYLVPEAQATGTNLRVYPSLIEINAPKPNDATAKIFVENLSDSSVNLQSQFKLFEADPLSNGTIRYLDNKNKKNEFLNRIQLLDSENSITQFTLGPRQKKELQIKITLSENENNSDYYFSAIFVSSPKSYQSQAESNRANQNSFSQISIGVASNIILSVGVNTEPSINVEEFSTPRYVEKGPVAFKIKIHNNTSKYVNPRGNLKIINMFGQTIGTIDLPQTNILSYSSRHLGTQETLHPTILWNEKLLFGFYEAQLTIKPALGSPEIVRTIHFSAFPLRLSLIIILTIFVLVRIIRRVRQKMSE